MKKYLVAVLIIFSLAGFMSCGTVNVESQKINEIQDSNRVTGSNTRTVFVTEEEADKRERERKERELNIITTEREIFIPVEAGTQKPLNREQVVKGSMSEALVTPQNFIGGTMIYDYDEHKQYPVVCKVLGLTTIQLENGEAPIGEPYLSDKIRWEVTGDVWRTVDGKNVQLVMIKPHEAGLTTNMVLITNRRIYQIILSSTRDSYMPMVKFRYPLIRASSIIDFFIL